MNHLTKAATVLILSALFSRADAEVTSLVFNDVVKSTGVGSIDLFSPKLKHRQVDGVLLESFRVDNNGSLVFAMDVNEASDGSENADSQGVTIKSAVLVLEFSDQTLTISDFSTKTRSLLKSTDNPSPTEYFTMLGEAGSSLITPNTDSELYGSSFDSTMTFNIEQDLTGLQGARVDITLLETLPGIGDPEAYYDFSNGFEEIALISAEDRTYLDQLAPGRDYAPLVITEEVQEDNWSFYPASGAFYVVAYEDLFPNKGDYDFNDLVVAYQVKAATNQQGETTAIRGSGFLITRGGVYDHDFYLGIDLPANTSGTYQISFFDMGSHLPAEGFPMSQNFRGSVNIPLATNIANSFYDGGSTYVNTFADQNIVQGPKFEFEIVLDAPFDAGFGVDAPFDPFIFVHDTGYEIHLAGKAPVLSHSANEQKNKTSFKDSNGFPFAMLVSENWMPPLAGEDMGLAYPDFIDHVQSNGTNKKDWFTRPNNAKIKNVPFKDWTW